MNGGEDEVNGDEDEVIGGEDEVIGGEDEVNVDEDEVIVDEDEVIVDEDEVIVDEDGANGDEDEVIGGEDEVNDDEDEVNDDEDEVNDDEDEVNDDEDEVIVDEGGVFTWQGRRCHDGYGRLPRDARCKPVASEPSPCRTWAWRCTQGRTSPEAASRWRASCRASCLRTVGVRESGDYLDWSRSNSGAAVLVMRFGRSPSGLFCMTCVIQFITRGRGSFGQGGIRMKQWLKVIVPFVVAGFTLGGPLLSSADAEEAYCIGRVPPIECWVKEPNVWQPATDYPQIQFQPGDHVYIEAGGCVQTGGAGLTWKRYVDPASDNDLYHGLISIPSATPGLVRLLTMVNRTVVVTEPTFLTLGYEDDNYSDNGYWGHDDGTGGQCRDVGNAWVHLTITQ